MDSHSFSSPLLCGRKRVAADPESTKTTADENSNKKSKVTDDGNSSEILHTQKQVVSVVQKRKNRAAETLAADVHVSRTIYYGLLRVVHLLERLSFVFIFPVNCKRNKKTLTSAFAA